MCVLVCSVCCVVQQMEAGQRLSGADIFGRMRLVSSVLVSHNMITE